MTAMVFLNFLAKAEHLVVDASKLHCLWQIYYWLLESEILQSQSDNISSLQRRALRKLKKLSFFLSLESTMLPVLYVSVNLTYMMTSDFCGLKICFKEKNYFCKDFQNSIRFRNLFLSITTSVKNSFKIKYEYLLAYAFTILTYKIRVYEDIQALYSLSEGRLVSLLSKRPRYRL